VSQKEIICIGCPMGCHVMLTIDSGENITGLSGNQCKEGRRHAMAEWQHPERVLTATVLTEGSSRQLLPVRTDRPVPKDQQKQIMRATAQIKVKPPVKVGQVIMANILSTGTNLIATGSL
jgi:CxxC motif-containing protein